MSKARPWITLQGLIAVSIVICLLTMLAVTALQGYRGARAVLVAAASDSAKQIGALLNERAERLLSPGENALSILVHDPLVTADSLRERASRMPALAQLLGDGRTVSAVYAGYPDGEFFLVRRVPDGGSIATSSRRGRIFCCSRLSAMASACSDVGCSSMRSCSRPAAGRYPNTDMTPVSGLGTSWRRPATGWC